MNQEWLELRWRLIVDHKMAVVHGTLCTMPPHTVSSIKQYLFAAVNSLNQLNPDFKAVLVL
jgi:hypothetical protein